jgi:hydrogenase maturation protease
MNNHCSIIVVGIGNPLLRDDTAGLHALEEVERRANGKYHVIFKQLFCGGFDLLTELASFSRAFIIDCLCDGQTKPGDFKRFEIRKQDWNSGERQTLASGHGIDLAGVLRAGSACGYAMPDPVIIYGIGALDVCTFDERPTPPVCAAIRRVATGICSELSQLSTICDKEN